MDYNIIAPEPPLSLFVRNIMIFEGEADKKTVLPFFADGYPGLIFFESEKGLSVYPHDKQMPVFFIYGQTLEPLELVFETRYRMIVFQFYPFILRSFFNIDPKTINDNCHNLLESGGALVSPLVNQLQEPLPVAGKTVLISNYLLSVFAQKQQRLDTVVRQALVTIIDSGGQAAIADVCRRLGANKRTLERRFFAETGLLPKQFAQIIQFHNALQQLTGNDFYKLTDIVYENGFSDQSHFIKVFRAFTGKTPTAFSKA